MKQSSTPSLRWSMVSRMLRNLKIYERDIFYNFYLGRCLFYPSSERMAFQFLTGPPSQATWLGWRTLSMSWLRTITTKYVVKVLWMYLYNILFCFDFNISAILKCEKLLNFSGNSECQESPGFPEQNNSSLLGDKSKKHILMLSRFNLVLLNAKKHLT